MNMKKTILACAIVSMLSMGASSLLASDLLGVSSGPTDVVTFDQTSGLPTTVGPTGFGFPGDLASDTRAGSVRVWAPDLTTGQLLSINPATGAGTAIGAFTSPTSIVSMAFDITTGKLFGNTSVGFGAVGSDALYEIDPSTGATTFIGQLGIDNVYALCFDNTGRLFGVGYDRQALFEISPTTGAVSLVGAVAGAIYDIATRPEDGVTFAVNSATSTLYTLDLGTAALTSVGAYPVNNYVGLAFVPEPASLCLLVLGGLLVSRRRVVR